jgi:hypothetical protein
LWVIPSRAQARLTSLAGGATAMVVQGGGVNRLARIQHDLKSVLPANTTSEHFARATLKVYISAMPGRDPIHLLAAGGPWPEGTLKHGSALATRTVPGTTTPMPRKHLRGIRKYMALDVTEIVRDWLDGTVPNGGLVLVPGIPTAHVSFDAKKTTPTNPRLYERSF